MVCIVSLVSTFPVEVLHPLESMVLGKCQNTRATKERKTGREICDATIYIVDGTQLCDDGAMESSRKEGRMKLWLRHMKAKVTHQYDKVHQLHETSYSLADRKLLRQQEECLDAITIQLTKLEQLQLQLNRNKAKR